MKILLKFLKGLVGALAILIAGLYISGYGHIVELGIKVIELGRSEAGLEDYLHFDVREIPKSDRPMPWAIHKKQRQNA